MPRAFLDLNPAGYFWSYGVGIHGNRQVGYGNNTIYSNIYHALLWSGSADTVVDLNPGASYNSSARNIHGNQVVGYYKGPSTNGDLHAALWDCHHRQPD